MDTRTGHIERFDSAADARAQGFTPVPQRFAAQADAIADTGQSAYDVAPRSGLSAWGRRENAKAKKRERQLRKAGRRAARKGRR